MERTNDLEPEAVFIRCECPACEGSGREPSDDGDADRCTECAGTGWAIELGTFDDLESDE